MNPAAGVCDEKKKLSRELEDAAMAYGLALRNLSTQMAVVPKKQYDALRSHADELRLLSESARLALERHLVGHGC